MESPFNLTSVISATKDGDSKAEFEFPDHEYMKLDSTKLKTEKTKSNKEITSVEKKLVEQAESLRRLAILYVLLAVGIVITFATFGTFTHVMMKRIDNTENRPGMSQADYERLEVDRADDRSIIESQQTRIITLEQRIIQQSATLETHDTKIEELESGEATVNYTAGIIQLEAYIDELNSTLAHFIRMSQAVYERLEAHRADDRRSIESQQSRITTLEHSINQHCTINCPVLSGHNNISFSARIGNDRPISVGQAILFDDVLNNDENAYSPLTGIFTTPIAGKYLFSCTITQRGNEIMHASLLKNDVDIGKLWGFKYDNNNADATSVTVVVNLDHGDTVWVKFTSGDGNRIQHAGYTYFSGVLILSK